MIAAGPTRRPVRRFARHPLAALAFAVVLAAAATPALATTNATVPLGRPTWTVAPETRAGVLAQAADAPPAAVHAGVIAQPVQPGPSPLSAALRSLVLPGWGQLATGHRMQAATFFGLEAGSWVTFITFQRQGKLRRDAYFETARLYAGIDLEEQDERMRRLVGQYQSNEVYNQYVVRREAAFFIDDPAEQEAYIATHELGGAESWAWSEFEDFLRYREQRRTSEQAFHNAEFVVGFGIANRLVSAIMAARQASSLRRRAAMGAAAPVVPAPQPGQPDGSFAWGVAPSLGGPLEGRVGWTVRF